MMSKRLKIALLVLSVVIVLLVVWYTTATINNQSSNTSESTNSPSLETTGVEYTTYTHPTGFSFQYPKGWTVQGSSNPTVLVEIMDPQSDTTSISVRTVSASNKSLSQIITEAKSSFQQKGNQVLEDSDIKAGADDAHVIETIDNSTGTSIRLRQILIVRNNTEYIAAFIATDSSWTKYTDIVKEVINSFAF